MKIRSHCHRAYVEVMDTEQHTGLFVCQACQRECRPVDASRFKVIAGDIIANGRGTNSMVNMVWPPSGISRSITVGCGGFHEVCIRDGHRTGEWVQCAVEVLNRWTNKRFPVIARAEE